MFTWVSKIRKSDIGPFGSVKKENVSIMAVTDIKLLLER